MKKLLLAIFLFTVSCSKTIVPEKYSTYKLQFKAKSSDQTVGFIVVNEDNNYLALLPKNSLNEYSVILKLKTESKIGIREVFNGDTSKPLFKYVPK